MIIARSPGGGTDAVGRVLATEMEKVLGTPITVVNRTGGAGVIGHTEMVNAKPTAMPSASPASRSRPITGRGRRSSRPRT